MLTTADRAQMIADMLIIRGDNPESIVIRRKNVDLAAQTVRIARAGVGSGRDAGGSATVQAETGITVLGGVDLDIARGDRFTVDAVLYEVDSVLPNRTVGIMARARMVQ